MSPQGVGEGNHIFKKSYEGLVSRLEGVIWKNMDNDKISAQKGEQWEVHTLSSFSTLQPLKGH